MVQFHETVMGKRFIEHTMPALVDEVNKLKSSNEAIAEALLQELHMLNENLNPTMERDVATSGSICRYLDEGWRPVLTFRDSGGEYIIVERRVQ